VIGRKVWDLKGGIRMNGCDEKGGM